MSKTTKVLTTPSLGTKVKPIHQYDDEQTAQIEALREYANTLLLPDTDEYYPWELKWLSRPDTIPRYMRAAKWKLEDGKKRIKGTLEWRRDFKPDLISPDEVKIESETGKIILNGFDIDGRPIIYMRPGHENTERSPRQVRHLVWWLERARDFMPPGQESLVIIVDYKSTTLRTNPSISVASKVLTILQQHYVEHLGRALVVNLPYLLNFFYKGISPFLDPVTRDKMRFNPNLLELIPKEQLDADFGGDYHFEFEKDSYWQQVVEFCGIAADGTRVKKEEEAVVVEEVALSEPAKDSTAQSDTPTSESTTDLAKEVDGLTLASPVSIPEALEADTQVLKEAVPAAIAVAA
ncbi:CRAL/TRIO domain-containing protein [Athelia psychrophila]|uniref:CRAL/TRIO domain-containing protein n=1 Tax=Athelia psychrophila TaxID=1759441 RepID=A0A165YZW0_9AGAM|nr:CRAL/TRIO domain-containing protein [Fibularhizoctonia sp. CBS 109695]